MFANPSFKLGAFEEQIRDIRIGHNLMTAACVCLILFVLHIVVLPVKVPTISSSVPSSATKLAVRSVATKSS